MALLAADSQFDDLWRFVLVLYRGFLFKLVHLAIALAAAGIFLSAAPKEAIFPLADFGPRVRAVIVVALPWVRLRHDLRFLGDLHRFVVGARLLGPGAVGLEHCAHVDGAHLNGARVSLEGLLLRRVKTLGHICRSF